MKQFVLYKNEVRELLRQDHFGDPDMWLLCKVQRIATPFWVFAKDCTLLDPALNILFERKDDGQKTTTDGRRRT